MSGERSHWEAVYVAKGDAELSWFEDNPETSLRLLDAAGVTPDAAVIDIGGGASRLVDALVARGHERPAVLDLSAAALDRARARLEGVDVEWIVADVTEWTPPRRFDVWHDRAAFHFLVAPARQQAYRAALLQALAPGGTCIIGTFAPDGPERCSGLPVQRHDHVSLGALLGVQFALLSHIAHDHATPWGSVQHFQFSSFRRL